MTWTLSASGTETPTVAGACTISNASPAVVTFAQNLAVDDRVFFTTTGTLPAGLSPFTNYFVISAGLSGSAFQVSATQGGAAINTSSAGSGTHTCWSIHTLVTDTNNATFVLEVDSSNMTLTDSLEIFMFTITLAGGIASRAWKGTWAGVQITPHKISPPIASDQSITCSIMQGAGTARAFPWKLLRI